ncbi:hypothetical protein [Vogesella indigofera]|uniref:hypothetical protein n=1 Tax=Vogesella indigofera TaxID=45465 RepID=UPI0035B2A7AA
MATHDRKGCTSHFTLVAPPISNTVAAQITKDDQNAINQLRQSHFYMICGRAKATFHSVSAMDDGLIEVVIELDSGLKSAGRLHIDHMAFIESAPENFKLRINFNKEIIRIFQDEVLVFATTPDDILMRRGRKQFLVDGFDNYREISTYDLLYVGIAKENQDSYSRLIAKGHKARMDILAAEPQRSPGARVSDETYLLLFKIEPLVITTFGSDSEFDDDDINFSYDYHRIVADAEKAVISVFKPKYNNQLYINYPKGTDGLYKQGFNAYTYALAEGFAFNTLYGTFKGARSTEELLVSNDADFICVSDDVVTLHIAGKDFNVPIDDSWQEA